MDPKIALEVEQQAVGGACEPTVSPMRTMTDGALALDIDATDVDADAPVTREQRRSRRKREVRARTISVKRMTKRELELGRMLYPDVEDIERPKTRADCAQGERPCPFVSCKHHL